MRLRFHRLRYYSYVTRQKLRQVPTVIREYTPQIVSDETCKPAVGDVYAIVVKYVPYGIGADFLGLLDALANASVNAIVVCNGTPSEGMLAALRARAHRILVRANIGRDFGAYRAATLHLHSEGLAASRVLYANDSLFFLPGPALDALVKALAHSDYDVMGAAENHEFSHHVGSFCLSVSGAVFRDPRTLAFWKAYKPYDLRPHAINEGELKLTRRLRQAGYRIDVVYRADHLAARLQAMPFSELVDHLRYMPSSFYAKALTSTLGSVASLASLFAPGAVPQEPEEPSAPIPRRLLSDTEGEPEDRLLKSALVDHIMQAITEGSQIHYGFGLLHKVLGCPLVKKDLLQRNVFAEQQMMEIFADLPEDLRNDVMRELINRGRPTRVRKQDRFLAQHGLI